MQDTQSLTTHVLKALGLLGYDDSDMDMPPLTVGFALAVHEENEDDENEDTLYLRTLPSDAVIFSHPTEEESSPLSSDEFELDTFYIGLDTGPGLPPPLPCTVVFSKKS